ncbi:MAG: hypothetical protein UU49_C0026G0014 [Candidatus Magasanikbacteria bacterium GW2011_GWC2_41_17]|uniref:Uncharacterized protein n=1 Tax=Candidatus Magasanikbacteria bacterium GW2011_GWC2_41_17 TaxID=1619048 RepID=A0A0G0V9R0_9BACT|nr:MAG: hypothetical protein UU49_C0026G0014 [Candidatus Magasanikbacteria bacterium GW2011_GWC2_41_17]
MEGEPHFPVIVIKWQDVVSPWQEESICFFQQGGSAGCGMDLNGETLCPALASGVVECESGGVS